MKLTIYSNNTKTELMGLLIDRCCDKRDRQHCDAEAERDKKATLCKGCRPLTITIEDAKKG